MALRPSQVHFFRRIAGIRNYSSQVELTSKRYKVSRGNYAALTGKDVEYFESILDKSRVVTDPSDLEGHNTDWLHMVRGKQQLLKVEKGTVMLTIAM